MNGEVSFMRQNNINPKLVTAILVYIVLSGCGYEQARGAEEVTVTVPVLEECKEALLDYLPSNNPREKIKVKYEGFDVKIDSHREFVGVARVSSTVLSKESLLPYIGHVQYRCYPETAFEVSLNEPGWSRKFIEILSILESMDVKQKYLRLDGKTLSIYFNETEKMKALILKE